MTTINVHDRLITSIEETGGTPIAFTAEAWATPEHPSIGGAKENWAFGWHPPYIEGTKAIVQICTPVITKHLFACDEAEVNSYLSTIEFLFSACIAGVAGGLSASAAMAAAEDELDGPILNAYNDIRLTMLSATLEPS